MTMDQLNQQEKDSLGAICVANSTNIQAAVLAAYEAGIIQGALRITQKFALAGATVPGVAPTAPAGSGDDDEADAPGGLSPADRAALNRLGINPDRAFRIKNSVFTITGYKASRWKYPVSAQTQNGTRYKFTVEQVKRKQQGF